MKQKRQNDFTTVFFDALERGHEEVIRILLENCDIDVDAGIENDCTPLFIAAKLGHTALVELLLNTGKVNIEADHFLCGTPLCVAAKYSTGMWK